MTVPCPRPAAAVAACATLLFAPPSARSQEIADRYEEAARRIIVAATADHRAFERMAEMVDRFGHRLSGSEALELAHDWILEGMRADGLENVQADTVMVPHWVRGRESLELLTPRPRSLPMLGLGGSVGTPAEGIRGEVVVVSSYEELEARRGEVPGRIVLFDVPFTTYGATVQFRVGGAVAAARAGAVAALLRSVGPESMQTPHTGTMRYEDGVPRIPFAAVTLEDAAMLRRMQEGGNRIEVLLRMEARTLPDAVSRNVMGELRGWEFPEQIVVLGGHTDSWDVGQGAMDDAGGVVATWEAVRLLKELGLRPRRTLRVVGWTNEENGLRGGIEYAERRGQEDHVLAIESDAGVFRPLGFGFTGSDRAFEIVREIGTLLQDMGAGEIVRGGGGADIGPLMQQGVPGMGLNVDETRYFWYHHTDADTVDKLDPDEMALCVAALAVMAYVVADLPERLPR